MVEHEWEDVETADRIRSVLMSERTKTMTREMAVVIHRARGYDNVTWEYQDPSTPQEHEDEGYDDKEKTMNDDEDFEVYDEGMKEEVLRYDDETEVENEEKGQDVAVYGNSGSSSVDIFATL
jgi:hypothetical protein